MLVRFRSWPRQVSRILEMPLPGSFFQTPIIGSLYQRSIEPGIGAAIHTHDIQKGAGPPRNDGSFRSPVSPHPAEIIKRSPTYNTIAPPKKTLKWGTWKKHLANTKQAKTSTQYWEPHPLQLLTKTSSDIFPKVKHTLPPHDRDASDYT